MKRIAKILLSVALVVCCLLGMMLCTQAATEKSVVTSPKVGVAYKLGIDQTNKGTMYYFTGEMSGYYGASSDSIDAAVNVYLETATGGYYLSFTNASGSKQYINVVQSGTYTNFTIADSASTVYTYDSQYNTLVTDLDGESYYLGTYNNFVTFGASKYSYISTSFPAHLYTDDGSSNSGSSETTTTAPAADVEVVSSPKTGVSYKLGIDQTNKGAIYFFTGEMSGYYGATETTLDTAVDVSLETATGGYYLTFKDSSGNKKYITMVQSDTHYNFTIADSASTVYTYNSEYNTLVTELDGETYYMGTYSNYVTFGFSNISKISTSFPAHLYTEKSAVSITTQPSTQKVKDGATAKFTVTASGSGLTYQWQYRTSTGSWTNVSAASGKTANYSLTAAIRHNGYRYRCKITDKAGNSVYSKIVYLYVLGINTQPTGNTVKAGVAANFTVVATGNGLTYQWQYRTSSTGSWTNVSAASGKTANYSLTTAVKHHGYQYRCKVTDSASNVIYTKVVNLYVLGIKTQPVSKTVVAGKAAKFTVVATGNGLTYQWQYRTSSSGSWKSVSATSGKTAKYSLNAAVKHHGYQYRCKVTDSAGNVAYTKVVNLYVLGIKTQPTNKTVVAGKTAKFTVVATGNGLTYQWQYRTSSSGSWTNIYATSGKTANYSLTAQSRHNGYQYRCKITDSDGNVLYTNTVKLTVK